MDKKTILREIRKQYASVSSFARSHDVRREAVYKAVNGEGARAVRVAIALLLDKTPSDIWPGARAFDDKEFAEKRAIARAADNLKATGAANSPWLNFDDAVSYLRVKSPKTLRAYISRGVIPYAKQPETGALRFHRDVLDEWLKRGMRG